MNIVEPILYQCKLNPLTLAIAAPGSRVDTINYGTLEKLIHGAAQAALKAGIAPRQIVGVFVRDTILHTAIILGLMRLGVITVSLRAPRPPDGIVADAIVTDMPRQFADNTSVIAVDYDWLGGAGTAPDYTKIHPGNEDDICRIILTSGSTGDAKGIAFTHKMLADRIANYAYSKGPRFAHCARLFCDLGIATSPGFRYALALLSRGGAVYFLGDDPSDILQAVDLHQIKGMATSPYGLGEFLKFYEADSAFEVTFDHIICQGAMLSRELSRRVRMRMCQNVYSTYGATETTTVALGPASMIEAVPGAVGYVLPGVTVEAVDDSDQLLPPMQDGLLRIRSHNMVSEYYGDPETSREFFRDGWFYSGDIGHLTPEGLLVISGRKKTALNIGGDTVNPERVEAMITSFPGVTEAGAFAINNTLGIAELYALIVASGPVNEQALRDFCAQRLPNSCVPARLVVVDALPRAGQGKLDRPRLVEFAKTRLNLS
jgi:acyl-CoA synthetase (AMP-forming)/AMP-acid ligase II